MDILCMWTSKLHVNTGNRTGSFSTSFYCACACVCVWGGGFLKTLSILTNWETLHYMILQNWLATIQTKFALPKFKLVHNIDLDFVQKWKSLHKIQLWLLDDFARFIWPNQSMFSIYASLRKISKLQKELTWHVGVAFRRWRWLREIAPRSMEGILSWQGVPCMVGNECSRLMWEEKIWERVERRSEERCGEHSFFGSCTYPRGSFDG